MQAHPNSSKLFGAATGLAVGALFFGAAALGTHQLGIAAPPVLSAEQARELDVPRALSNAYRKVAREIDPSIVSIVSVHKARLNPAVARQGAGSQGLPPGLAPFFGGRFGGPGGGQFSPEARGQGSGVIVSADGLIATNAHVVDGADEFEVTLLDGRKLPARLVGIDRDTDVAAIRVEADDLSAARFGDSRKLEPGELVMAVGTPFGLEHSVSTGVVSAMGRSDVGVAVFEDLIQTDAAINPGNSGGPLLNLDGEVIGINTAIRSRSGGFEGIGFAVPSRTVERVLRSLEAHGSVERGFLGASIQSLSPELAESFGLAGGDGALVAQVLAAGPAERAGLQPGDIVTAVDRRAVSSSQELRNRIAELEPGSNVELDIWREGAGRQLEVELGRRPSRAEASDEPARAQDSARWGIELENLTPELAARLGVESEVGVVVANVEAGSPAQRAGLTRGDVIVSVDGQPIDSPERCARLLRAAEGSRGVRLHVQGQGGARFVLMRADSQR